MATSSTYDVVVVGGGMAGLTAAYRLRDHAVLLLEASSHVGGRVKSYRRGRYWVNLGAQFLAGEGPLWSMAEELGVETLTLRGSHPALVVRNRILVSESPARFALGLPISPVGRLAMVALGLKIRRTYARLARNSDPEDARSFRWELDQVSAAEYFSNIRNAEARAVLTAFVRFWMGAEPEELSAGHTALYLGLSIANLSEVPPFSLVVGGNQELAMALGRAVGDRVQTSAVVDEVRAGDDAVRVRYRRHGEVHEIDARECVVAVPAHAVPGIVTGLSEEKGQALRDVQYGTYIAVGFFTDEEGPQAWDELYAATVVDKSFQVVINPATVLHRRPGPRPKGGALLVYAGGQPARALLDRSDAEIIETFRADLEDLLPGLRGRVVEAVVQRWPHAIPYWEPGGRNRTARLREPVGRVHFAGDYVAYPSMQVAAASAITVAERVGERMAMGVR